MAQLDPLERLMAKFDITGQQGSSIDQRAPPATPPIASSSSVGAPSKEPASAPSVIRRTLSLGRRPNGPRRPTHLQQLKHALTVNAAHVMTHDYLTLSQPLAEGLLLMDRTERKLKLIQSLGELQPLHQYTTEYGNSLVRHKKHEALLAGSIEIPVESDEAEFDKQLERMALNDSSGTLQLAQRQATYNAFASAYRVGDGGPAEGAAPGAEPAAGGSSLGAGHRLGDSEAAQALERVESLTRRIAEMEDWFVSVKAEAASDRQMRDQATARLSLLQERLERVQEQLGAQIAENKQLRGRLDELRDAEPDTLRAGPRMLQAGP